MSLTKLIRDIVKPMVKTQVLKAVVLSVDKLTDTCEVALVSNESERYDVQLKAVVDSMKNGIIFYPKVNSNVLVSIIGNNDADCFIVKYSELEEIVYMDGVNGGLIKIIDLVAKLNTVESDLNAIKSAFTSWIPIPNDGGAALKASSAAWSGSAISPTTVQQLENAKFKH